MDPALAHVQYIPSIMSGGVEHLPSDYGFGSADAEDLPGDREGGLKLWEAKYKFRGDMLPMFVGEAFGRKVSIHPSTRKVFDCDQIFSTGKSLNFIRYSCHDSDWVATREKMGSTGGSKSLSSPVTLIQMF